MRTSRKTKKLQEEKQIRVIRQCIIPRTMKIRHQMNDEGALGLSTAKSAEIGRSWLQSLCGSLCSEYGVFHRAQPDGKYPKLIRLTLFAKQYASTPLRFIPDSLDLPFSISLLWIKKLKFRIFVRSNNANSENYAELKNYSKYIDFYAVIYSENNNNTWKTNIC